MGLTIGKSKSLVPRPGKVIRHIGYTEQRAIEMTKQIAKDFGEQSKRQSPKVLNRIIVR